MSKKSGSMSVATFSSIQMVKYYLKSKQKTSTEYFHRSSTNHTPVSRDLVKNMQHATKEYEAQLITKKQGLDSEIESLKVSRIICQTAAEAKRIKEKAIERANNNFKKKALKRKPPSSAGSSQIQKRRRH